MCNYLFPHLLILVNIFLNIELKVCIAGFYVTPIIPFFLCWVFYAVTFLRVICWVVYASP